MKEYLKSMKISFILAAILYIALGLVLLIWPGTTMTIICYAFGAVLVLYGLVTIISFFAHDSKQGSFAFELFLGIVAAALGVLLLVKPEIVQAILPTIVGLFIVVDGLVNLKRALELRRLSYTRWHIILILSLVSVALGLLVVFRPLMALDTLIMLIGIVFIYEGVSDLWAIVKVTRLTREWRKRVPVEVDPIDIE